ncbi:MAG: hypothetical protein IJV82_06485 [Oscillospiraceae bacterium]|nr:hypothetical protein [Oscillospiraceae bacterium]
MYTLRKILIGSVLTALLVLIIVFWGTMAGAALILALIQGIQFLLFNRCASSELAKTFQEEGKHVRGWRQLG